MKDAIKPLREENVLEECSFIRLSAGEKTKLQYRLSAARKKDVNRSISTLVTPNIFELFYVSCEITCTPKTR